MFSPLSAHICKKAAIYGAKRIYSVAIGNVEDNNTVFYNDKSEISNQLGGATRKEFDKLTLD